MTSRSELAEAAFELAANGHPVLPLHTPTRGRCSCGNRRCDRPGKHPRGAYGLTHATTNPDWVCFWWSSAPEANIGMRTDGLVVLDVDGEPGQRSLAQLERDLAPLPRTRVQTTGRGQHRLYSTPAGATIGNSTRPLGNPPGIDLRAGSRGYIVAAPSLHSSGNRYEAQDRRLPAPLPDEWLRVLDRPAREPTRMPSVPRDAPTTAYGRAALDSELERLLVRAQPGNRNNELTTSVFRLAQLVAGGELNLDELQRTATRFGYQLGLDPREIRLSVSGAVRAGLRYPRSRAQ